MTTTELLILSPLTSKEIGRREDVDAWVIAEGVALGDKPYPPRVESFQLHRDATRQRLAVS